MDEEEDDRTNESFDNNSLLSSDIIHNNLVLPTPSCTGSMDSLSSSSGSERQVSFTTFGKSTNNSQHDDRINEHDILKPSLVLIENENILDIEHLTETQLISPIFSIVQNKHNRSESEGPVTASSKQNDSTDEDSGIESIMRITKKEDF